MERMNKMDSNLFVTKLSCESESQSILWDRIHDLEKEIKELVKENKRLKKENKRLKKESKMKINTFGKENKHYKEEKDDKNDEENNQTYVKSFSSLYYDLDKQINDFVTENGYEIISVSYYIRPNPYCTSAYAMIAYRKRENAHDKDN